MLTYKQFCKLGLTPEAFGLEAGETRSDYLCEPKNARVIGWTGVDGIHYSFVRGFDEMVFAINPSNAAGENVHPVARSFAEFLSLLIACGEAAIEQAWQWDREGFDRYLREYPLDDRVHAAAVQLREYGIEPCADPYGYIKDVQAAFDYSLLTYRKSYYECLPKPVEEVPREWCVTFSGGFWSGAKGKSGEEIAVDKRFCWNGESWWVPSVYLCGKGIVVDLIHEVAPERMQAFIDKWQLADDRPLSEEEREQIEQEHPLDTDFRAVLTVNGDEIAMSRSSGSTYMPQADMFSEDTRFFLEHYGCDMTQCYELRRMSFECRKRKIASIALTLEPEPKRVEAARFVAHDGDVITFEHPETGAVHRLTVHAIEREEIEQGGMPSWSIPSHCQRMDYSIEPEIPQDKIAIRDILPSDEPRHEKPDGAYDFETVMVKTVISSSDGPTAVFVARPKPSKGRAALSALHFEPAETVTWRVVVPVPNGESVSLMLV